MVDMGSNMICSSIRKRPDWSALLPALLQDNTTRWKGKTLLETHDVAMPLPLAKSHAVLRANLLTPSDVGTDVARNRIERLYNLNGGQYAALILLMKSHGGENCSSVLMRLQLELVGNGLEMPIIPVVSAEAVPTTLLAFHHQLSTSGASQKRTDAIRSLLPYCSGTQELSEHTVNVLSDITGGVQDLAQMVSTPEGRQKLMQYLNEEDVQRVISFWGLDYLVE